MVVISESVYDEIVNFILNYKGLAIECEADLESQFPDIPANTLKSILSKQGQNLTKAFYSRNHLKSSSILREYQRRVKDDKTIMEMSKEFKCPPMSLCRMILNELYSKTEVKEMLKDPDIIPDLLLSANVFTCIFNDSQDGIIIDMVRYTVGEEYEVKLKKLAREAGLIFYDEGDLRRDGFDKTPDLLLAVQSMYKNTIINWIESKASFGDCESHTRYLNDQLQSYYNRFGVGIVVYWAGFHENILNKSKSNLIILDNFPSKDDFEKLTFQ